MNYRVNLEKTPYRKNLKKNARVPYIVRDTVPHPEARVTYLLVQETAVSRTQHTDVLWPLVLDLSELLKDRLDRVLFFHHLIACTIIAPCRHRNRDISSRHRDGKISGHGHLGNEEISLVGRNVAILTIHRDRVEYWSISYHLG